ncbi:hypothetical protein [Protofrankia coriariae]|uniref:hypothetical protein n=1 Tax=Protofrankia coriariae TaxID=1562887 RepID=UPI00069BCBE6
MTGVLDVEDILPSGEINGYPWLYEPGGPGGFRAASASRAGFGAGPAGVGPVAVDPVAVDTAGTDTPETPTAVPSQAPPRPLDTEDISDLP